MRKILLFCLIVIYSIIGVSQNVNMSNGLVFDGEPFLIVNPLDNQHMVIAWLGYQFNNQIVIKTRVSNDGGNSWSVTTFIPHVQSDFTSADPSMDFDAAGNVFLCYIDYRETPDTAGGVYVVKSIDGGLTWGTPVQVIDVWDDGAKEPLDRPWLAINRVAGSYQNYMFVTTKPAPDILPPNRAYFMVSTDGNATWQPWKYLDDTNWLIGDYIAGPMTSPTVDGNGNFQGIYPSYVPSQFVLPQFVLATSTDGGQSFSYHSVYATANTFNDSLAKEGYCLCADPSETNHMGFLFFGTEYGDADVFFVETLDDGISWTSPVRVNDDSVSNDRMQDLVWGDFDSDGDFVAVWRDRRNGDNNSYATGSEIWGSVLWKDSSNFSANFLITDSLIPYDSILALSGNDFSSCQMVNDNLYVVWGDPRTGKLNIFFQKIDLTTLTKGEPVVIGEENLMVFPNPVDDKLNIDLQGELLNYHIRILNASGVVIRKERLTPGKKSVSVSDLKPGIYFIEIKSENTTKIIKFVKS
ncbi:MAG: T9SS type A sorting domain-containing protein [Bacteroidales bacterium]|nr:T9SS type A sorting domain-containing protein [Bacteroidales bacterium]